jgi:hypothetical protein
VIFNSSNYLLLKNVIVKITLSVSPCIGDVPVKIVCTVKCFAHQCQHLAKECIANRIKKKNSIRTIFVCIIILSVLFSLCTIFLCAIFFSVLFFSQCLYFINFCSYVLLLQYNFLAVHFLFVLFCTCYLYSLFSVICNFYLCV